MNQLTYGMLAIFIGCIIYHVAQLNTRMIDDFKMFPTFLVE